ncbi:MAG: hypothetical protein OEW46_10430, partial [Actinomycetota bacterium]|nr:hypothetical protein [Actinomycetota bacterium]
MSPGPSIERRPPTATSAAKSSRGRGPTASTTSAPRSPESLEPLAGPVAICIARPLLSLDRSFTSELPSEIGAGLGSLVSVPFHGRATRGWVLGSTDDVPARTLPVAKLISPTRWFDEPGLALCRWVSERYVAPLAAVLERATPPRVAGEEGDDRLAEHRAVSAIAVRDRVLERYRRGDDLVNAIAERGRGAWVLRPAPEHEGSGAVEVVAACLDSGRRALVIVPEASPVPGTARAIEQAFGDRVGFLLGG